MAFLDLCDKDPLVTTLSEVFGANIVRVPEERIQPLSVIASDGSRSSFRGALGPLLVGTPIQVTSGTSQMADLSGKRSRSVNLQLGLQILQGFLSGFGIPSAGIGAKLQGASEVSFTFKNVTRTYVDPNVLGSALAGRALDRKNPAAAIFLQDGTYTCLVIDSVIASSDFAINVDKKRDESFNLDVPVIQNLVSQAKAGVQVTTTSGLDLIFQGSKSLAFAFTCVRLYLDAHGVITSLPPEASVPALAKRLQELQRSDQVLRYTPDRIQLRSRPGLLSWDET
jgi:hypothetical protein